MAFGKGRGAVGRAKLSAPRSADRARVPPVLLRTTEEGDMKSPAWLFFIVELQVNCGSKGAGCLVTSACGSKGVKPRTRQTRRRLKLVSCPMQVLGVLISGSDRAGRTGRRKASLGTTWLWRKGGRPALVDATLQITHLQGRPRAEFVGRPLGNPLYERLNDCYILQIIDQNGPCTYSL